MSACIELATIRNEPDFAQTCATARDKGIKALLANLWNGSFFKAMSEGSNSVMADCLYGQVWAYTLGLGPMVNEQQMRLHLEAELAHNDSPYGLTVLTGRPDKKHNAFFDDHLQEKKQEHPLSTHCEDVFQNNATDDVIWMGGSPDWTTLMLWLGGDFNDSMSQAEKALGWWRTGLNDMWNINGIIGGVGYGIDGQPYCTSHYGFHMVLYHIPFAISGQYYNAVNQTLQFNPATPSPYQLPWFVPTSGGYITSSSTGHYSLTVLYGSVQLSSLSIDDIAYPFGKSMTVSDGETLSWSGQSKQKKKRRFQW